MKFSFLTIIQKNTPLNPFTKKLHYLIIKIKIVNEKLLYILKNIFLNIKNSYLYSKK